jgi:hypothetical protein
METLVRLFATIKSRNAVGKNALSRWIVTEGEGVFW